jgi:hypothetical protein
MSKVTMKPKYIPDPKSIFRGTDPQRAKRELHDALEGLQRPTPPMFFEAAKEGEEAKRAEPVAAAGRGSSHPWKLVAGLALVAAAMPVLVVLAGKTKEVPGKAIPSATVGEVVTGSPAAVPSGTATAAASAMVMPKAVATVDAVAAPTASTGPSATAIPAPGVPHTQTRRHGSNDDPYDAAAPIPPATAAPLAPPVPLATAGAAVPFILRKREP